MTVLGNFVIWIWLVFWAYWVISSFSAKKSTRSRLGGFMRIRLAALVVLLIVVRLHYIHAYTFNNLQAVTSNKIVLIIGFVIFLLGLLFAIWARLYLGKNWGMPMTKKLDTELVTTGPYGFVRHPIYTGILLAIIGTALVISLYWLVIFGVGGAYFIYSATVEEKNMLKEFPKVYPDYKNKTKMLIPFIL